MLSRKGLAEGRYAHRRGEALFALTLGAFLSWQGAALAERNILHLRLLHAVMRAAGIAGGDLARASRSDATSAWLAGRVLWNRRDSPAALRAWQVAPSASAERLASTAQQEWWRGDQREALDSIRAALALQPDSRPMTETLGVWRTARSEYSELAADTEAVLARAPRNATALAYRGWSEHTLGREAESRATLEAAFSAEPSNRVVLQKLSRFLVETGGDAARIERLLVAGDRRWPDDDFFYYQLAQFYFSQRRYDAAEPYMRRLLARRGNDASAREVVGLYRLARGERREAIEQFQAAARLEPQNPRFRDRIAEAAVGPEK